MYENLSGINGETVEKYTNTKKKKNIYIYVIIPFTAVSGSDNCTKLKVGPRI